MSTSAATSSSLIAIVGAGPAGLIAAERLSAAGYTVQVYDGLPSVGRKFLQAGRGGLNITHSEPLERFIERYGAAANWLSPLLHTFGPAQVQTWCAGLGIETFAGSSGRVFPRDMKAAPLLRAWLKRLQQQGVTFHLRHHCQGWNATGELLFSTPDGEVRLCPAATLLAMGGASWPRLGTDGSWSRWLGASDVSIAPFAASNCGVELAWSSWLVEHFAGSPLKNVILHTCDAEGHPIQRQGECVITRYGLEGSLIYPFVPHWRSRVQDGTPASLWLDLLPGHSEESVRQALLQPRGSKSMANHLRSRLGLDGAKAALLRVCVPKEAYQDLPRLAALIKRCPLQIIAFRPMAEAISTAGGVCYQALTSDLMLQARPGVFCAGEMIDWEAPTGGYLLTACYSTGWHAAQGMIDWLTGVDR